MSMCNTPHRSDVQSNSVFGGALGSTQNRAPEARRQDGPARSEAECWVRRKSISEPRGGGTVFWHVLVVLAIGLVAAGDSQLSSTQDNHSANYHAMQQKLGWLKLNAARPHPDSKPTDLTEPDINAYFAEGGVKMPKGVSRLRLSSQGATVDAHADVDFEQIMQGRGSSIPLYSLFSGTHDVHAVAQASGTGGVGTIRVQSIDFDGVTIPQFALEWFVEHYLAPKYLNVGVTSTFKLPLRIESATVETGKVRLVQR